MLWMLFVILHGTDIQENVYFNDLDTCLEYAGKMREQDLHQDRQETKSFSRFIAYLKKVSKRCGFQ